MPWITCPLQTNAQKFPDRTAIVAGRQKISYAQFHSAISLAEQWLVTKKINKNNRVALIKDNSVDYLITLLALWRRGAVACLINPRMPSKAIQAQLKQLRCDYVLTGWPEENKKQNIQEKRIDYNLEQEATILFTSGTSAQPKAVVHSFGNHYYNALGSNEHIVLKDNDRWLLSLPLYHVSGLGILLRVLLAGATIVLASKKEALEESIQKYRVTHISLVPTQLFRLFQKKNLKLPSLKSILLGGAPIPDNLLREAVKRKLPIYITYGLSEMASQTATSERINTQSKNREAKILKYRKVKVSSGEILVKGKTLFKGYARGRKIYLPIDKNGWFRTGDLGVLKNKKYLKVTGRKDNMFISGGENIQPEEIERYLHRMKEIEQAVVVAVEDKEFGFRPAAFIKMRMSKKINAEKIKNYLRKFLPSFKIPDRFCPWPALLRRSYLSVGVPIASPCEPNAGEVSGPGPRKQKEKGLKVSRLTLAQSLILS